VRVPLVEMACLSATGTLVPAGTINVSAADVGALVAGFETGLAAVLVALCAQAIPTRQHVTSTIRMEHLRQKTTVATV
jgi:hypothetical protein